ncbi:hypothetical protein ACWGIU_14610 [Streptomyces sp. NPDC054840]
MADARPTVLRIPVGPLLRPRVPRPRFLTEVLAGVARSAWCRRRRRIAPTCEGAAEHRSFSGGRSGSGAGATGEPPCRDTSAGTAGRRERAHEAVTARTTSPDDLAALLAMLDLQTGPDERRVPPEED